MSNRPDKIKITDPTRIITLANGLSVMRAFLTIPIVYCISKDLIVWTVVLIIFAVVSDFLDGIFARRAHEITNVGKILDPMADKIIIFGVLLFLILDNSRNFPSWFFIMYIIRDLSISISGLIIMNQYDITLKSLNIGKWSIGISTLAIFLYIIELTPYNYYILIVATVLLIISWIFYLTLHISYYRK